MELKSIHKKNAISVDEICESLNQDTIHRCFQKDNIRKNEFKHNSEPQKVATLL